MKKIIIKSPGLLTTVQDNGRSQLQHLGIPACGVMDYKAFQVANVLVGNNLDLAVLECTWSGPILEFTSNTLVAITGAEVDAKLNGYKVPTYTTIVIKAGDVLDLTTITFGVRAYVAVAGGINVPKILESRSTYLPIQFGDSDHKLKVNDELPLTCSIYPIKTLKVPESSVLKYTNNDPKNNIINIVEGPQINYFSEDTQQSLTNSSYTLSAKSDRMGLRFEGVKLELLNSKPMISDGIPYGAMQITRGGLPIVMMADRQPTGGYPKIAKVAHSDLPKLAQLKPGNTVEFNWITLDQARDNYFVLQKHLKQLIEHRASLPEANKAYRMYINNVIYQTTLFDKDEPTK
ncbi:biotin-dependent carboxyltransferase family protein [Clostridium sp. 'deep sea']|uniref:5-oxoprolinase subunit C family protein n=1 Tax=Clostridium sp. 'deep sea' TaxID=2779445 RepID=UPI00189686B0|nr:biotin-dependent carboxyltransferase family protein [Clostridium sp. 'deep sea']QOR33692.1 biotin-dependent carboxyltransferase family protein [Clostridium sp. 'deep sea']